MPLILTKIVLDLGIEIAHRPKKPLQPKHVWSIPARLEIARMWRNLVLSNLAIDSKLLACDLVKLRRDEIGPGFHPAGLLVGALYTSPDHRTAS